MDYKLSIYMFIVLFIVVFIFDYFIVCKKRLKHNNKGKNKKGKKKKEKRIEEIDYLVMKFKLNSKKLNKERMIVWISLINSFIIAIVSSVIMLVPYKLMWQMLIAFFLLFGLIYSLYEIYGRHLKKVEEKENGNK